MTDTKSKMETVRNSIVNLKERVREVREEYCKMARELFTEVTAELFEKYPKLNQFSWKQYTCYFNDGGTCYFSAHTDYFDMTYNNKSYVECCGGSSYSEGGGYCEDLDEEEKTDEDKQDDADVTAICNFISENIFDMVDDDDLQDLFGDHVEVVVTKDGLEVCDYHDHD